MGFFYPCEETTCGCRLTDTKMQCTTDNTFGELFITQTTAYKWSFSPEWFSPPDSNNINNTFSYLTSVHDILHYNINYFRNNFSGMNNPFLSFYGGILCVSIIGVNLLRPLSMYNNSSSTVISTHQYSLYICLMFI